MPITELDPSLYSYRSKLSDARRMADVKEVIAELKDEKIISNEVLRKMMGDGEMFFLGPDPDGFMPANKFGADGQTQEREKRNADIAERNREVCSRLKAAGLDLFHQYPEQVEHKILKKSGIPSDNLTVRTEEGFRIYLTKSSKHAYPGNAFLKIGYELDGIRTAITIAPFKIKDQNGGLTVYRYDHAVVAFYKGEKALLENQAMDPAHGDSLSGILSSVAPISAKPKP
ncbi:MAG TPA: hypothetical protein VNA13_00460 [Xanthomonadales bacterium]|nr:hypothetical protein [Xanthomonadales bacterium]